MGIGSCHALFDDAILHEQLTSNCFPYLQRCLMDSFNFDALSSQPGLFVPAADPGNPFFEIWRDGSEVSLVHRCYEYFH